MFRKLTIVTALSLGFVVSACGASKSGATDETPTPTSTPSATTGTIALDWSYTGSQAPSKVKLLLIDGQATGLTCTTLPYSITTGIVQTINNMPANGAANFTQIAPSAKYLAVAVGESAAGTRVAEACHDQVNVNAGATTNVSLSLLQFVADLTGIYDVTQNLNIGLPSNVQNALIALAAGCVVLNNPQLCNVVTQVSNILTSMDVVAEWTIDQKADGTYTGAVTWKSVQGLDVSAMNLVTGNFDMQIDGSTAITFKNFDLTIQFGNLVVFLVENQLNFDLGQFGPFGAAFITALAGNYVSPLDFTGTGTIADVDHDGIGDQMSGNLNGHLSVGSWNHDFQMDYFAIR